jgi:hypothetical protein
MDRHVDTSRIGANAAAATHTGRYLPTDVVARGPAIFDTARPDRADGIDATDVDPMAGLGRRATGTRLSHSASFNGRSCPGRANQRARRSRQSTLPNAATPVTPWSARSTKTGITQPGSITGWADYRSCQG